MKDSTARETIRYLISRIDGLQGRLEIIEKNNAYRDNCVDAQEVKIDRLHDFLGVQEIYYPEKTTLERVKK